MRADGDANDRAWAAGERAGREAGFWDRVSHGLVRFPGDAQSTRCYEAGWRTGNARRQSAGSSGSPSGSGGWSGSSLSGGWGVGLGFAVFGIAILMGIWWLVFGPPEHRMDYGVPGPDRRHLSERGFLDDMVIDVPAGGISLNVLQPSGENITNKMIYLDADKPGAIWLQRAVHRACRVPLRRWYRLDESLRQFRVVADDYGKFEPFNRDTRVYVQVRFLSEVAEVMPAADRDR